MIHRICLLAAVLLLLASSPLPAQRWREMWADPTTYTPLEVKAEFDAYYATHKPQKGEGYKQFMRYWQVVGTRLGPQGELMDGHARAFQARRAYDQAHPPSQARTSLIDGNWYDIGADIGHYQNGTGCAIGRISVIAFHPTLPSVIYVGTPVAGIWRTIDHGNSWAPLTSDEPFWGVCALAVDPNDGNTIWAITGDDFGATRCTGVFKSTDAGATWANKSPSTLNFSTSFYSSRKIVVDPDNSSSVFATIAGPSGTAGLFHTTDGGTSWTKIFAGGNLFDMEMHPTNPNILYVCDMQNVYRSTDGGSTWSSAVVSFPGSTDATRLAVSPASPNTVYAIGGGPSPAGTFPGLYRSTNSGATWTLQSSTPNIQGGAPAGNDAVTCSWWSLGLAVNPSNASAVHMGSLQEWYSTNSGVSWGIQNMMDPASGSIDDCHSDCHFLTYNNGKLYYGNDGGIYYSTNEGAKWIDISAGLHITDLYKTASTEADPCRMLVGAQEASTNLLTRPSDEIMELVWGGDGMDCAIDPDDPDLFYFCGQGGALGYSAEAGLEGTGFGIAPNNLGMGNWVTPIQINPKKSSTLLAAYTDVGVLYRAGVGSWVNLSFGKIPNANTCFDVKFAPNDTMTIYVSKGNAIYRTTNYGGTWADVTTGLYTSGTTFTGITVNPTNSQHLFVTLANWVANKKVYESTNGGGTWTNISGTTLPNVPANCIVYQEGSSDGVYMGTDAGVFYRDDITGDWQPFSDGLPYVAVNDLDIVYATKKLRAATSGRGPWETNLWGVIRAELLSLSGPTTAVTVNEAYGQITSSEALSSPADITYRSATGVLLTTGFTVNAGAKFLGVVSPCMDVPITEDFAVLPPVEVPDPAPVPTVALPAAFTATLFPNPSDQRMTLRLVLPEAAHSRVEVFDLAMRRIASLDDQDRAAGTHELSFETGRMPAGSYLVRITAGPHTAIQRLVVQH